MQTRELQSNRVRRSCSIRLATFSPTTTRGEVTSCDPTQTETDRQRERETQKGPTRSHSCCAANQRQKPQEKKKIQNEEETETETAKYVAFYTLGRTFYNFYSNCSHCPVSTVHCPRASIAWRQHQDEHVRPLTWRML